MAYYIFKNQIVQSAEIDLLYSYIYEENQDYYVILNENQINYHLANPNAKPLEVWLMEKPYTEIWHDENYTIQIVQHQDDVIKMLEQYPEVGMLRKQLGLITYSEGEYKYFYLNNLLPEHRYLFNIFNAIINQKS